METLSAVKISVDLRSYRGKFAAKEHAQAFIDYSCTVHVDNSPLPSIVYVEDVNELTELESAVKSIKYQPTNRTAGMKGTARIFGYSPRNVVRGFEACRANSLEFDFPSQHRAICDASHIVSKLYRQYNPRMYAKHLSDTRVVLDDWKIGSTPFTSGIVNKDNKIPYHFDAGNFSKTSGQTW